MWYLMMLSLWTDAYLVQLKYTSVSEKPRIKLSLTVRHFYPDLKGIFSSFLHAYVFFRGHLIKTSKKTVMHLYQEHHCNAEALSLFPSPLFKYQISN